MCVGDADTGAYPGCGGAAGLGTRADERGPAGRESALDESRHRARREGQRRVRKCAGRLTQSEYLSRFWRGSPARMGKQSSAGAAPVIAKKTKNECVATSKTPFPSFGEFASRYRAPRRERVNMRAATRRPSVAIARSIRLHDRRIRRRIPGTREPRGIFRSPVARPRRFEARIHRTATPHASS